MAKDFSSSVTNMNFDLNESYLNKNSKVRPKVLTKQCNVRLPVELWEILREKAFHGRTTSALIREYVEQAVKQ